TVHENARSAVECGSLLPLSLRPACWPWKGIPCLWRARPRASSRDQSGSKLRHSTAPAALNSCVFNRGFAYFHGSRSCPPRHPESMKKDARAADGTQVRDVVDSKRNRAGTRPTPQWRYEPARQSGQDVATNPKLKARKRPRKADCSSDSDVPRARFAAEDHDEYDRQI